MKSDTMQKYVVHYYTFPLHLFDINLFKKYILESNIYMFIFSIYCKMICFIDW